MAERDPIRIPNESTAYREARTALLAEEIELRRHLERVARQRRALPPGGEVAGDYRFVGEEGVVSFAGLFGDRTRWWPTATCTGRNASGRVRCARR